MPATFNPFTGQLDFSGMDQATADARYARLGAANTFTAVQTITSGTLTASAPWLSATQTWNEGSTVFRGQEIAITETAAAAGSSYLRILGGTAGTAERFAFVKVSSTAGSLRINGGLFGGADTAALSVSGEIKCDNNINSYANVGSGGQFSNIYGWGNLTINNGQLTITSNGLQFNLGANSATPAAQSLGGQQGSGANITGGALYLSGGRGTGTGSSGPVVLQYHAGAGSSSVLGTLVDVFSVKGVGLVNIASIPTSASGLSTGDIWSNSGVLTIV